MHPYTTFRLRLARHAVAQLAARLRGSAEIVALVLGPALLGLLACVAMPAMLAAAQALPLALPLLLLHGVAMSLPVALLRPRVAPTHVRAWLHPLPIPAGLERRASAAVAALLAAPLALAYAASLAIWLHERPGWLMPARAVAGTLLSFLLTWACAAWILVRAAAPPRGVRRAPVVAATAGDQVAHGGWRYPWRQLFWLPLWRGGQAWIARPGPRQAALLAGTIGAAIAWMTLSTLPRAAGAIVTSILLVLLVHDADAALRAQTARVRALGAAWPLDLERLAWRARGMLLLGLATAPAAITVAGSAAHAWTHTAGRAYLALAWTVAPLLVLTPPFTARGRMALVALAIMLLCATGSQT